LKINTNLTAATASRNLHESSSLQRAALERLSSGLRINRASDDASGAALSQSLRAISSGSTVAVRNTQDAAGVLQTAEGALVEVHAMLHRMGELATAAANSGGNDAAARQAAQDELVELVGEVDRIASTTRYGSTVLLDGSYGMVRGTLTGFSSSDTVTVDAGDSIRVTVGLITSQYDIDLDSGVYTGSGFAAMLQSKVRATLTSQGSYYEQALGLGVDVTGSTTASGLRLELANTHGSFDLTFEDLNGNALAQVALDNAVLPTSDATTRALAGQNLGLFHTGATGSWNHLMVTDARDVRITGGTVSQMTALATADVTTAPGARTAMDLVDAAVAYVSQVRADFGATANRLAHAAANLRTTSENLSASQSRIVDADMAEEMVRFTRGQILNQAGTAMLAQANQAPSSLLALLR